LAAIVGGSETNIGIIEPLLAKVDILILGGGMIYTFYKAQKYSVGESTVQEDKLELATSLNYQAKANGVSFLLPTDIVVAKYAESKVSLSMHKTSQMVLQSSFIYLINCGNYLVEILQLHSATKY
jgi:3-phosphoglycerate kinase